jgi:homospermidine synthase
VPSSTSARGSDPGLIATFLKHCLIQQANRKKVSNIKSPRQYNRAFDLLISSLFSRVFFIGQFTSVFIINSKVQHILDIWNDGQGVVSLHCFQSVIPVEAYTGKACMVEAIGKLT